MLEDRHRVIQSGRYWRSTKNSYNSTHCSIQAPLGFHQALRHQRQARVHCRPAGDFSTTRETGQRPRVANRSNSGSKRDCCHQGSPGNGVKRAMITATITIARPRSAPNKAPTRTIGPAQPGTDNQLPQQIGAQPAHNQDQDEHADEGHNHSCRGNFDPWFHPQRQRSGARSAINTAAIHTSSEKASRMKPRNRLTSMETRQMPRIARSAPFMDGKPP